MRTTGSLLSSDRYQSTFTTRTEINGESAETMFFLPHSALSPACPTLLLAVWRHDANRASFSASGAFTAIETFHACSLSPPSAQC